MSQQPGLVILLSCGETSASVRRVFDWLMRRLSLPVRIAVLETPAGFQPNSALVAETVADFIRHHLQNYQPQVSVVPARKRGTPFSPHDAAIVAPLLQANAIFLGGRQPHLCRPSVAGQSDLVDLVGPPSPRCDDHPGQCGCYCCQRPGLPVYEIYKVGDDLHWCPGLDLLGPYGLSLAFVSHWDNKEGGAELDTSRGFIGQARFEQLRSLLPLETKVVGIDEHAALVIDLAEETCRVMGRGGVTLCQGAEEQRFVRGQTFAMSRLGPLRLSDLKTDIPPEVWERVQAAQIEAQAETATQPPPEVVALLQEREAARARREWAVADVLRERIAALGWKVRDTPAGPGLEPSG